MDYKHITANGTVTIADPTAVPVVQRQLVKVSINKAGASSNTMTIYDGDAVSGSVVAVIDTTTARTIDFTGGNKDGVRLSAGMTIVTATGTAPDATVITC